MLYSDRYLAFMGQWPKRIPHHEAWSNPDAETYLTGIDYYEHPRLCRLKMQELYPQLGLGIPETDDPKPRPGLDLQGDSSVTDEKGRHHVRWAMARAVTGTGARTSRRPRTSSPSPRWSRRTSPTSPW